MTTPKPGEIRPVAGRLAKILEHDAVLGATKIQDHGPSPSQFKGWRWFKDSVVGEPVGAAEVLAERKLIRERMLDCNSPDCWCREFDPRPT